MNYWVVIDRRKMGPLTLEEARRLPLEENSYVWHRGLPSWVKAGELEEFADLFRQPVEVSAENGVNGEITENSVEPVSDNPDSAGEDDSSRDQARPMPFPPPPPAGRFPGAPYGSRPALPEKPPTYLGWSVASIICC
ncbi:MAG: CD225/dispanin family protein, partial [Paramuribaculum sp.]|nr:CD225/dispanin family protein [Paramuribaculum sp.]